jgi:hypothetical protein
MDTASEIEAKEGMQNDLGRRQKSLKNTFGIRVSSY